MRAPTAKGLKGLAKPTRATRWLSLTNGLSLTDASLSEHLVWHRIGSLHTPNLTAGEVRVLNCTLPLKGLPKERLFLEGPLLGWSYASTSQYSFAQPLAVLGGGGSLGSFRRESLAQTGTFHTHAGSAGGPFPQNNGSPMRMCSLET